MKILKRIKEGLIFLVVGVLLCILIVGVAFILKFLAFIVGLLVAIFILGFVGVTAFKHMFKR